MNNFFYRMKALAIDLFFAFAFAIPAVLIVVALLAVVI